MKIKDIKSLTVAAHRGDSYNYPENTMTAFENALKNGADMIETDVRLSKDGVLVLMHDDTVDRTTNGIGKVSSMDLVEILKLNAGDINFPEKVPIFEDFIKWASQKGTMLNVEIKEYYSEENRDRCIKCIEDVIALIEKYNMAEKTVLNSFDAWILQYIYKKYGKKYMLHGFYPYDIMKNVDINPDEYLFCACIFDDGNADCYNYLKEHGIEPWAGAGVKSKEHFDSCVKLGAVLFTSNDPEAAMQYLNELGYR